MIVFPLQLNMEIFFWQGIPKEVADQTKIVAEEFSKLGSGGDIDWEKCKPFYANLAIDIDIQKKRIGGNFAIAQAVTSEEMRNHIRLELPDCIFITLTMTKEAMIKRIKTRHGENVSN